ncbi:DUF3105 domain-containing protein [Zafaria sp. Z1313]|uniref:DUF3105 domain-containing protein n=1 Tax=unclassified Zafaria TaxID=2828765 RepID=UPI002E775B70|nr:DUF3105 domain-containing protein [Zafaria sp. J156]MEE1622303.1 DUF3105 domain-containing protein [Zafaria sp. J156]
MNRKNATSDREPRSKREQALALVAAQERRAKRGRWITAGVAVAAVAAIAVPVGIVVTGQAQARNEAVARAAQPIDGAQEYEIVSANHVQDAVEYETVPGVGGDHFPVWQNCGIYTDPVQETAAVHSLEHGAVWISYNDDAAEADIAALTDTVGERSYLLLSPVPAQEEPIKLSAWGVQLVADSAQDPRIADFIQKYRQGPQTPEPGAACTGGIG